MDALEFHLLARGFARVLRQAALEELADGGVEAQPPFPGPGRELLLERLGHATVDDLSHPPKLAQAIA